MVVAAAVIIVVVKISKLLMETRPLKTDQKIYCGSFPDFLELTPV